MPVGTTWVAAVERLRTSNVKLRRSPTAYVSRGFACVPRTLMFPGAPKYTPGPSCSTVVTVVPEVDVHVVRGAKKPASRSACVIVCRADVHVYAARAPRLR